MLVLYRRRRELAVRKLTTLSVLVAERTKDLLAAKNRAELAVIARNDSLAALERARGEVAEERARFKLIFESVPVGIAFLPPGEGGSVLVNPAPIRMTGISALDIQPRAGHAWAAYTDDLEDHLNLYKEYCTRKIDTFTIEKRFQPSPGNVVWVTLTQRRVVDPVTGANQSISTLVDITERKSAEARLVETHRQLVDASRKAGMAEVATNVLHNVGNVLNSVTVSATLVADRVRHAKISNVEKLAALIAENKTNLAEFITKDPRGRKIPEYIEALAVRLRQENLEIVAELEHLNRNVAHIKEIVAMQQTLARTAGAYEPVPVIDIIEDSLQVNAPALGGVEIIREFSTRSVVTTDRHKVMQILINLIRNAQFACIEGGGSDGRIVLRTTASEQGVTISIIDNGAGIAEENLTRIFAHGFTTRKHGHGFGLHSGALAAKEIGGVLNVASAGLGKGATFTLSLPYAPKNPSH